MKWERLSRVSFFFAVLLLSAWSVAAGEPETREWREPTEYMRLDLGFTVQDYNFASAGSSEFQRIALGDKDRYELRLDLGYQNRFNDQAITFGFGGSYNPWKPLRLSLDLGFAPNQSITPKQDYAFGVEQSALGRFVYGGSYRFQHYQQADLHRVGPLVRFKLHERFTLSANYEISETRAGGDFIDQAFGLRAEIKPFSVLTLYGSYGRSGHHFEAGAPDNPFKSYASHDIGAGLRFQYIIGNGLFFDFADEERDNNQSMRSYTIGTFLEF